MNVGVRTVGRASIARGEWSLIIAIVLVAINLRPGIVSIGPILGLIQKQFGLSHATASLLTAIPDLLMGLLALPTPWLARRFGRNPVLLCALLLLCIATLARAFSNSTAALLCATVGVGAGISVAGALFAGLIKSRFPSRAALLMGIYATALSFGSTVAAASTGLVASSLPGGWRTAAGMWGVFGVVAIVGWWMVERSERLEQSEQSTPTTGVAPGSAGHPAGHPLPWRDGKAWLIALFFAGDNLLFYALISWLAPMYREYGLSTSKAGLVLASFTAVFMCSNPIAGWLSKSHDRRGWLMASGVLVAAGLTGIAMAPVVAPVLWVGMVAVGLGGGFTLGMTLPLDNTHSADEANSWNAFVLLVGYLIAAGGPLTVGWLRDLTGGFHLPVVGLIAVAVTMVICAAFLKPRTAHESISPLDHKIAR
jgi:MFS transporter, CP family, cyanate transporter